MTDPLWTFNGSLLKNKNTTSLRKFPNNPFYKWICCCPVGTQSSTTTSTTTTSEPGTPCEFCTTNRGPDEWEVTIEDITSVFGGCLNCEDYNGTWVIPRISPSADIECLWQLDTTDIVSPGCTGFETITVVIKHIIVDVSHQLSVFFGPWRYSLPAKLLPDQYDCLNLSEESVPWAERFDLPNPACNAGLTPTSLLLTAR